MVISKTQKKYGYYKIQTMIDDGSAFKIPSVCTVALALIKAGACLLPIRNVYTTWDGRRISPRLLLTDGEEGTVTYVRRFYKQLNNDIETI